MNKLFVIVACLLLASCIGQLSRTKHTSVDNQQLLALFKADQKARSTDEVDWEIASRQDKERREEVLSVIKDQGLRTAGDFNHAAMVFQHGETAAWLIA